MEQSPSPTSNVTAAINTEQLEYRDPAMWPPVLSHNEKEFII